MIQSLEALLREWKETREMTLEFVNKLSDEDLDKKLPRKVLNTIRLQVYELILFQRDVVNALPTTLLQYEDEYKYENLPKEILVNKMLRLDTKLETVLKLLDGTEMLDYYGTETNVHQIMSMMISHESMHLGQIIAFCYATGIEIPKKVTEEMVLEG